MTGRDTFDKMTLWTKETQLRGTNIYQVQIYSDIHGSEFMGPGPVGPPYTEDDFSRLASLGANLVIVSHPGLYEVKPPYKLNKGIQDNLDKLLDMIAKADMFAVIAFRIGPGRTEFSVCCLEEVGDWFDESDLDDSVWNSKAAQDAWTKMWHPSWEPFEEDAFDFLRGPDPNIHQDTAVSDLINVILKYWGYNTLRPSKENLPFISGIANTGRNESIVTRPISSGAKDLLKKVKTWFYFLHFDLDAILEDLIDSAYDMVVIEPIFTEKENEDYNIKEAVRRIKSSPGANLANKLVLAYIDIGEAESYRYYWKKGWKIGDPDFIAGLDPDLWEDNFPIAFWQKEWQDIWFEGTDGYDAQLQNIIKAGFDGVYLDWVEAYSDENVMAIAEEEGIDTIEEMKEFVKRIKEYGTSLNPNFIVIAQNAAELAEDDDYASTIDAIAQEHVWFDGSATGEPQGDCPLPATDEDIDTEEYAGTLSLGCKRMYIELPEGTLHVSSKEYIDNLIIAQHQDLPIFAVDYVLEEKNISLVYEESRKLGFTPFVSNRPLDMFVDPR